MAFVVETGAGVANANSYASVAAADAYATDRGIDNWISQTTTEKQRALIKATDYLEAVYREAWKGYRVTATQGLSWPRCEVVVDTFPVEANIVPGAVVNACVEMALRATTGTALIEDQGQTVKREKVDVIEVEYADYSDPTKRYPAINSMLQPYLLSSGATAGFQQMRIVRT